MLHLVKDLMLKPMEMLGLQLFAPKIISSTNVELVGSNQQNVKIYSGVLIIIHEEEPYPKI